MHKIVVFGAGKSSLFLIKKLQDSSEQLGFKITLVDQHFDQLPTDCLLHKNTQYLSIAVEQKEAIGTIICNQDLVISMLPAHLHICIAQLCLSHGKNLLTASYVQPEIKALHEEVKEKGLLFLNEMGVDPGLDHISALELIDQLKLKGASIKSFYSHTGGLMANPIPNEWNYKFTWNPKNVIIAGAEGATQIKNNTETVINYASIFKEIMPVTIDHTLYDSYPNRNSTPYKEKYQLEGIENLYRGTLRHQGYCEAWDIFVQLGMTDDTTVLQLNEHSTRHDFFNLFLNKNRQKNTALATFLNTNPLHPISKKMASLGFLSGNKKLPITHATAATILLHILTEEWKITPQDKDLLVMQHKIVYTINNTLYATTRELSITGDNHYYTAMSKTVGLPMFEAALLILNKKIRLTGVQIPTNASIYAPILSALSNSGIIFKDTTMVLK